MPRPLHEPNTRNPTKIPNNHAPPVGAGPIRRAQHPRPLHERNNRNPTKIQINFATDLKNPSPSLIRSIPHNPAVVLAIGSALGGKQQHARGFIQP